MKRYLIAHEASATWTLLFEGSWMVEYAPDGGRCEYHPMLTFEESRDGRRLTRELLVAMIEAYKDL